MQAIIFLFIQKDKTMKTIKYIITAIVILSTCMGGFSNLKAQENILFAETYKRSEITSLLEKDDRFFTILNSSETDPERAKLGSCPEADAKEAWKYLNSNTFRNQLPEDLHFAWGWDTGDGTFILYALRETQETAPGKKDLSSVNIEKSKRTNSYNLLMSLSEEGAKSWARMTRENVGRNIAIVIEGKVVAAPVVNSEIKQGKCMISGNFSKEEITEMKALLEK